MEAIIPDKIIMEPKTIYFDLATDVNNNLMLEIDFIIKHEFSEEKNNKKQMNHQTYLGFLFKFYVFCNY